MKTLILTCIALVLFVSCSDRSGDLFNLNGQAQGSTFSIKYQDSLNRDFSEPIDSIFQVIDNSLSLWVENSSINRLNKGQASIKDPHLFAVLSKAQDMHWKTGMAFDPTVDTLMQFWGFRGDAPEPDTNRLSGVMNHVGLGRMISRFDWSLEDSTRATLTFPAGIRVTFDPNGIAQGYTVDVLAAFLEKNGIRNFMVEVGGEVKTRGRHPQNRAWRMQIDKPVAGNDHIRQAVIALENTSMATSGNYRKYREVNGLKYGHTIDPRTGYPVDHGLLSATVITDECAIADALATAFMVLGAENSMKWLRQNKGVKAYFIMDDGLGGYKTWQSEGLEIEEAVNS